MATFKRSNFGKQNTPPIVEKIGNALLLIGALGGVVAILPVSAPLIATIGAWVAVAGAMGKIITKFSGKEETPIQPSGRF